MEEQKKKYMEDLGDKEIVYSQAIKAGKRIYYLDVKRNRKEELFLAITESKKIVPSNADDGQVFFEKHKIFLYQEDFDKFAEGLKKAIDFIHQSQQGGKAATTLEKAGNEPEEVKEEDTSLTDEIKIDIDF